MSKTIRPNRLRAFTIPEVLAVVAIIVIIMSIILPMFGRAKVTALRTVCATNEHNWGAALRSYSSDNRTFFPDNRFFSYSIIPTMYPPTGYRSGYHISWNSSVVERFWRDYLVRNNSDSKTNVHDVLNCPTQLWHQVNDVSLTGGLVGYFYMPGRSQDADTNYGFAGAGWVFKDRFGGPNANAPIMSDMKQWHPTWGWFYGAGYPNAGSPISSHARSGTGEAEGGNFLFEDVHVTWYESDTTGNPDVNDPNDIIKLGADVGGWRTFYSIPLN